MPATPWGLADIQDILPLNREYNEKATDISDIINYHTAPVTVITGAKAANLERGANKIWALTNKDAKVENLEGGTDALEDALNYLELIKRAMHEIMGIPETALGQSQPISNTSGVALSIQYHPLVMKYELKKTQYEQGLKDICALALKNLFLFEPETLAYNPDTSGIMTEDQAPILSPKDPDIFNIDIVWPPPLPVDVLIKLNEIQMKMELGLESRVGALEDLNVEFPDEKLQELFREQIMDAKMQGALDIVKAHINAAIIDMTGTVPEGVTEQAPPPAAPAGKPGQPNPPAPKQPPPKPQVADMSQQITRGLGDEGKNILSDLVTVAFGTKLPQFRNANSGDNNSNS